MCLFAANIEQPMAYFSSNTCSIFFSAHAWMSIRHAPSIPPTQLKNLRNRGMEETNLINWNGNAQQSYGTFLRPGL